MSKYPILSFFPRNRNICISFAAATDLQSNLSFSSAPLRAIVTVTTDLYQVAQVGRELRS